MTASMTLPGSDTIHARNVQYLDEHLQMYISSGRLAGTLTAIHHKGQTAHWSAQGLRDRERGTPMTDDTVFRIYSMTKPIVSLALMQLYERGLFQLDDPVHKYIPSWEKLRVYQSGTYPHFQTVPCDRPMTVRDLLTHQSGLTYGFMFRTNVDAAYRQSGLGRMDGPTLKDLIETLAEIPLEFSPGTAWNYSVSTDVVGYLVEVISGQPLDAYLQANIFRPLGMTDTGFQVRPEQAPRLSTNYQSSANGGIEVMDDAATSTYLKPPSFFSGGGGLVSTAGDYLRFSRMLLGNGTLDSTRIIGRKTLELMTQNHIAGGRSIAASASAERWQEPAHAGAGFGLGFAVALDTADGQISGSPGAYYWSGAASTHFWIDPAEDLAVVFMTQYLSLSPTTRYNLGRELRAIIYGALD